MNQADKLLRDIRRQANQIMEAFEAGQFPNHECFEDGVQDLIKMFRGLDMLMMSGDEIPFRWQLAAKAAPERPMLPMSHKCTAKETRPCPEPEFAKHGGREITGCKELTEEQWEEGMQSVLGQTNCPLLECNKE